MILTKKKTEEMLCKIVDKILNKKELEIEEVNLLIQLINFVLEDLK